MVNCLTFLIVQWCCAVWSVSTWFSPIHQERFVNVATFVWWELEVLCVRILQVHVLEFALDLLKFCCYDALCQHFLSVSACSAQIASA